jgi:hypothetical protein
VHVSFLPYNNRRIWLASLTLMKSKFKLVGEVCSCDTPANEEM